MPAETIPPSFISAVLVTMLIVPPTEDIASFDDPKPLCTCIAEVTSDNPAQLLQKTLLFSMSFTGTPLIITAMFSCANPRIVILESPKPPPEPFVVYTEGVLFKISGNS